MLAMGTFETSNLWLAAFLRSKGIRLVNTVHEGSRAIFEFEDEEACKRLSVEFHNDGMVNIGALRAAWNDLKTLIFDR